MRSIELFCGIGLSSLGHARTSSLIRAFDIEPKFIKAFNQQKVFRRCGQVASVADADVSGCDLLSGGPVCKAFSPGATLFGTGGASDSRNTFPLFMDAVRRSEAKHVLVENSFGLSRFKGYVAELDAGFASMGYRTRWEEVDCYDYGVPQHRRRLVCLASRGKTPVIYKPERGDGYCTVGDALAMPAPASDPWPLLIPMMEGSRAYFLRDPRHAKKHPPLRTDRPASTVVAVYRKGVPYGVVSYQNDLWMCGPRLAARLQGLPDDYDLSGMSKTTALEAIGNGFPPQVVEQLVQGFE